MSSGLLVPVETYLTTRYQPDREFMEGEVVERNVGEFRHSRLQGLLYAYLLRRRRRWNITPIIEWRVRVSGTRYLIPDVCAVREADPSEQVLTTPPLLWVEILSREDRTIRVERKVQTILDFGVPYVWVIDPDTLESSVYRPGWHGEPEGGTLRVEDTDIVIPLGELE